MGKIIAVANQKGGVAKTTSTINLAYALLNRGKQVLAIDADPQASLTISFGQDEGMLEDDKLTLYFSLLKDRPISELVLKSNGRPDLVASSILLSKADAELLSQMAYSATLLREKLAGIVTEYDYILLIVRRRSRC
jgi:chromosome partitioning protein